MATSSISGLWAARNVTATPAPLVPPVDPEHLTPSQNIEYVTEPPPWEASVTMPGLPSELVDLNEQGIPIAPGAGPIDQTPLDHDYGIARAPGLTELESQDRARPWQEDDQGGPDRVLWHAQTDRDGTYQTIDLSGNVPDGASPMTVDLQIQGRGAASDPEATVKVLSRWARRFINRHFDDHRYNSEPNAVRPRFARPVPGSQAPAQASPLVSPFGNSVIYAAGPQDTFVQQQVRRQPEDWTANQATDGTEMNMPNQYGLTVWGQ
jgi:hypothetical protein